MKTFLSILTVMMISSSSILAIESDQSTKFDDNVWFTDKVTSLIREGFNAPDSEITIVDSSKWDRCSMKGRERWIRTVLFHFNGIPFEGKALSGKAITVFIYDPLTQEAEIMTPEAAAEEIRKVQI
jgi:hypothetical protein